jgi:hypothetical protein
MREICMSGSRPQSAAPATTRSPSPLAATASASSSRRLPGGSGGRRQHLALASITATRPPILALPPHHAGGARLRHSDLGNAVPTADPNLNNCHRLDSSNRLAVICVPSKSRPRVVGHVPWHPVTIGMACTIGVSDLQLITIVTALTRAANGTSGAPLPTMPSWRWSRRSPAKP